MAKAGATSTVAPAAVAELRRLLREAEHRGDILEAANLRSALARAADLTAHSARAHRGRP